MTADIQKYVELAVAVMDQQQRQSKQIASEHAAWLTQLVDVSETQRQATKYALDFPPVYGRVIVDIGIERAVGGVPFDAFARLHFLQQTRE